MTISKPLVRPARPHFSSGPCAKIPGWSPALLESASVGRSHRSGEGKARLKRAIDLTREVLQVPDDHLIGIVPASDTGAVEMVLWSVLGQRGVDVLAWESFGEGWVTDVVKQLKLADARTLSAPYGQLPDLSAVDFARDVVFTWNGTTSGVRVPDAEWIPADREGLTICDATSAVFAQDLDHSKLDVVTFSWQKVMGGEGAHGVVVLGPRAVERLEGYAPPWPLPKIFRMTKGGSLIRGHLRRGDDQHALDALRRGLRSSPWSGRGTSAAWTRCARGPTPTRRSSTGWVRRTPWVDHLAALPATRSNTSVCLTLDADESAPKAMTKLLEAEGVAFDIGAYRDAPPGLRIWCGGTVDAADLEALLPWLEWAHAEVTA